MSFVWLVRVQGHRVNAFKFFGITCLPSNSMSNVFCLSAALLNPAFWPTLSFLVIKRHPYASRQTKLKDGYFKCRYINTLIYILHRFNGQNPGRADECCRNSTILFRHSTFAKALRPFNPRTLCACECVCTYVCGSAYNIPHIVTYIHTHTYIKSCTLSANYICHRGMWGSA